MRTNRLFILIILALVFISCSKSIDELKKESEKLFNQAIDYYDRGYFTQAEDFFKKVIEIEEKTGNVQRKAISKIYLGLIYYNLSNYMEAENYYKSSLSDLRLIKDFKSELVVLNNLAGIYSILGDYSEAEKIYLDVAGKSLIYADKEAEAIAHSNLGDLYHEIGDFDKMFKHYNKSLQAYEVLGDRKGIVFIYNKLGNHFLSSNDFVNALEMFSKSYELENSYSLNYLSLELMNSLGQVYFQLKSFQQARTLFEEGLQRTTSKETSPLVLISLHNNLGDFEFNLGSYTKAIDYYSKALEVSDKSYLKYLSPIMQLKIARCYENLYSINLNETDKKTAERFYNFSVNRFKENKDFNNLFIAASNLASFYYRTGEVKKSIELFKEFSNQELIINLITDYETTNFIFKPDYDFTFLLSLIESNEVEEAFNFLYKIKVKKSLEYFLKFQKFDFLESNVRDLILHLKKDLYQMNTYHRILVQELALPESQRIKDKVKFASKSYSKIKENLDEKIKSLTELYQFLKPSFEDVNFSEMIKLKNLVYIEPVLTLNHLMLFIISSSGIESFKIKIDGESFKNNLKLLSFNLSSFKRDELKNFVQESFGQVRKEFFNFINSRKYKLKEIVFLLNDSELDLLSHILFASLGEDNSIEQLNFSYSYLINERTTNTTDLKFEILRSGKFQPLIGAQQEKRAVQPNLERNLRVRFRKEFNESDEKELSKNQNANCLLVKDKLIINQLSPEYSFLLPENSRSQRENNELMNLASILNRKYKFILFSNISYSNLNELSRFISVFHFTAIPCIVISLNQNAQEFSTEFLYNYKKSRERFSMDEFFGSYYRSSLENSVKRNSTGWVSIIRINN